MRDPAEEWRQLHALYAEMGDTELLELRRDFGDLTDMAQGELRDELKRRQLWDMPLPQTEPADASHADSQTAYDSFGDLLLGGVTVGEYDTVTRRRNSRCMPWISGASEQSWGMAVENSTFDFRLCE
jgi:hypothetical protein